MLAEFKKFALRGNAIDLAVGFIMGGAFGAVVNSLVNDILMPPIGLLLGKVDFRGLFIDLSGQGFKTLEAAKAANAPTINYGVFINTIINFVIIAFALFLLVRTFNQLTAKPVPPAAPSEKECPFCFSRIPIKATRCPHCTSQL